MSYYQKVLQPGESVTYIGRLHWLMYWKSILFALVTIMVAAGAFYLDENQRWLVLILAAVFAALTVVTFLASWFVRVTTEIVVTDKRIIHKTGWISRNTQEINLARVETVDVSQGILGRVFDYGDVMFRGTGGTWETPLTGVADPLALRSAIIAG